MLSSSTHEETLQMLRRRVIARNMSRERTLYHFLYPPHPDLRRSYVTLHGSTMRYLLGLT